jgi:phosphoribosylaminoimidazole-succinocarboxamide synthase
MKLVAEGKTKKVLFDEGARKYFLEFKDDITAFNMVKHEKMKGFLKF